jgi:hypothetical protein
VYSRAAAMTAKGSTVRRSDDYSLREYAARLDQFNRDSTLMANSWDRLSTEAPDQWVAAYAGKIIGPVASEKELIRALSRRRIPTNWTVIEQLTRQRGPLIR